MEEDCATKKRWIERERERERRKDKPFNCMNNCTNNEGLIGAEKKI